MAKAYTDRSEDKSTVATETASFNVSDPKGRTIGAIILTSEVTFTLNNSEYGGYLQAPGHYFAARIQNSRGGIRYGASQPSKYFATEAERTVAIAKFVKAMEKRAIKQFGK